MNFLVAKVFPPKFSYQEKKKFFSDLKHYYWEKPILYKHCVDKIIRRCVPEEEMENIFKHCHSLECEGHFRGNKTTTKVLQSGFYWPTLYKDAHAFVSAYDQC